MTDDRSADQSKLGLAEVVAIGIGGMVGGGIFAVLGLAMQVAGNAVPVAMALGGVLALLTGYSMAHLGLAFRSDGGSFTYIEHAFDTTAVAGIAGWLLVAGYVGTLALYASAFGSYGSALLSNRETWWLAHGLSVAVIVLFLAINLVGTKTSGLVELAVVAVRSRSSSFSRWRARPRSKGSICCRCSILGSRRPSWRPG